MMTTADTTGPAPATAAASPGASPGALRRPRTILLVMCGCVLLLQSLVAAINLAIAEISAGGLHPSSAEMVWIVDAYVIVFACLLIPAGMLGDRFGRKGMLLTGIAVFGAGALLCALAPDVPVLLTGRCLSGAGAALAMPASMSVLVHVTPVERRASAIASWSATVALGGIVGNAGGALILQAFPWQGLFWAYVPASLLLLAVTAAVAPRVPHGSGSLDMPGAALLTGGLVALLFGIIEGPELGWSSAVVLGAFAVSALLLTLFTRYELRARVVLLDPRLFRRPAVRAGAVGVAAVFFGMFAMLFVNAQFLQYVKGYSPLRTGFAIVPMAVGMGVVTQLSVRWARRFGERRVVGAGLLLVVAGLLLMSTATRATPYALYTAWLLVLAAGIGMAMPSLSAGILAALPAHRAGMGSGLNGAARELGAALGIACTGTVLNLRFTDQLPQALAGDAHSTSAALAAAAGRSERLHTAAVDSYTRAVATGYQTAAAVVLLLSLAVLVRGGGSGRKA